MRFRNQRAGEAGRLVDEVKDASLGLLHDVVGFAEFTKTINLHGVVGVVFDVFLEVVSEYVLDITFVFFVRIAPVGSIHRICRCHCGKGER